MDNKKGFTLIEILAVIIIIGIVALIAIPSITGYLNSSKETTFETYEKSMEDAAKNRIVNCLSSNGDCELPEGNQVLKTTLETLIEEGYIDNMKDTDSENFCDAVFSYVAVKGEDVSDYTYKACLYCGDYATDDDVCNRADGGDGDDPDCGLVTGESTRWTNENRTISVLCSDKTSGCERSAFSKTFNFTTNKLYPEDAKGVATITIRDNSGKARQCKVNAYVDKTLPTCKVDAEGEYIESVGWYSLSATAKLKDTKDDDSGLLTYGMGTSVKNRDYNKLTQMTFNRGITTAVGYVKDVAGNENICTKEIRIGTEVPKFNLYYGYQIFPDREKYTLNGITQAGNTLLTTSDNPTITLENLTRYKKVRKVKIILNNGIATSSIATLNIDNITVTAPMTKDAKEILFVVPEGTYEKAIIRLGTYASQSFIVNRIEFMALDGTTWTNKDLNLYVEPVDAGLPTTAVSFNNAASWSSTVYTKSFTNYETSYVVTKNGINMLSVPVQYKALIDKTIPAVSLVVTKKNTGAVVESNNWTHEGLNFTLTANTSGTSNQTIYYCYDQVNKCEPNIPVQSGQTITALNNIVEGYYFRYKIVNEAGVDSGANSYIAKFDTVKPVCSITNYATLVCNDPGNDYELSGIVGWYYDRTNTTTGNYVATAVTRNLNVVASNKVTAKGDYYLYVKDLAGNVSEVKTAKYYQVTYDKNGGTTNPTKSTDLVRAGENADLTVTAYRTGLAFAGWHTNPNATMGLSSYQVNSDVTLYAIWLNLWARDLSYDDTRTNLGCSDVQCALDKISDKLKNV